MPTPWSSWLIVAHPSRDRAPEEAVTSFLGTLSQYVQNFDSPASRAGSDVEYIQSRFGYPTEDIEVTIIISIVLDYLLTYLLGVAK